MNTAFADDSTFYCKQIDTDTGFYLTATSFVTKDKNGNYDKPKNADFNYMPDGKTRYWETEDGIKWILIRNQLIVQDMFGKVHGKVICS